MIDPIDYVHTQGEDEWGKIDNHVFRGRSKFLMHNRGERLTMIPNAAIENSNKQDNALPVKPEAHYPHYPGFNTRLEY